MWLARDKSGSLYIFEYKPTRKTPNFLKKYFKWCEDREFYWLCDNKGFYSCLNDKDYPQYNYIRWEDEPVEVNFFSFDEMVEVLCPPKHDGVTSGLLTIMLANKMKYMQNHKFKDYDEEKQWMVKYLKDNWNVACKR